MQNLFIKIRCFIKKIIFQLLSCLYLYDSSIPVPVCISKQSLCTDFWRLALIHQAVGIQTSGAGVNILCRRYTDFWRRREVCAKSVYRLLASKGLSKLPWCHHQQQTQVRRTDTTSVKSLFLLSYLAGQPVSPGPAAHFSPIN